MSKSKRNSARRSSAAKSKGRRSKGNLDKVVMEFDNVPFYVKQVNATQGLIYTSESSYSESGVESVPLDPYAIGENFETVAEMFDQYRILGGTIQYVPFETTQGVLAQTTSGYESATTQVTEELLFTWRYFRDIKSAVNVAGGGNYTLLIDAGGIIQMSDKRGACKIPPTGWLYCQSAATNAAPTSEAAITDMRTSCFGMLVAINNAAGANVTHYPVGTFRVKVRVAFRQQHVATNLVGFTTAQRYFSIPWTDKKLARVPILRELSLPKTPFYEEQAAIRALRERANLLCAPPPEQSLPSESKGGGPTSGSRRVTSEDHKGPSVTHFPAAQPVASGWFK